MRTPSHGPLKKNYRANKNQPMNKNLVFFSGELRFEVKPKPPLLYVPADLCCDASHCITLRACYPKIHARTQSPNGHGLSTARYHVWACCFSLRAPILSFTSPELLPRTIFTDPSLFQLFSWQPEHLLFCHCLLCHVRCDLFLIYLQHFQLIGASDPWPSAVREPSPNLPHALTNNYSLTTASLSNILQTPPGHLLGRQPFWA